MELGGTYPFSLFFCAQKNSFVLAGTNDDDVPVPSSRSILCAPSVISIMHHFLICTLFSKVLLKNRRSMNNDARCEDSTASSKSPATTSATARDRMMTTVLVEPTIPSNELQASRFFVPCCCCLDTQPGSDKHSKCFAVHSASWSPRSSRG